MERVCDEALKCFWSCFNILMKEKIVLAIFIWNRFLTIRHTSYFAANAPTYLVGVLVGCHLYKQICGNRFKMTRIKEPAMAKLI